MPGAGQEQPREPRMGGQPEQVVAERCDLQSAGAVGGDRPEMREQIASVGQRLRRRRIQPRKAVRLAERQQLEERAGEVAADGLGRLGGRPLLMSRLEYVTMRMLVSDAGPAPDEGAAFYRACGWSEDQIQGWRSRYGLFGKGVSEPPVAYQRLTAGETLQIDGRAWKLVGGDGHSPEHICLLREEDGVFIAGDQLLPRISSNVSVWPTEPDADPLSDWLASLERLKVEVPADVLVLPAHGEPFKGAHARLDALIRGHETSLKRLLRTLREPRRAIDVFGCLFARPIGDGLLGMATGESLAHLNCLVRRGEAIREIDAEGVWRWRAV